MARTATPGDRLGEMPPWPSGGFSKTRRRPLRGKRTIAVPPPLVVLPGLHRQAQKIEWGAAGEKWQDWDLVWCMPDGSPIDAKDDWDEWKGLLKLAEIDKDARVHDARHTAATLLLEQGVDIRVVQVILGHSQLTTTKRYTHVTEILASEAALWRGRSWLWGSASRMAK
ncbi:tyrosine-type recombinase/integrase [Streptosporangium sp. CA-135522]|uniref:tyrosine-type recombinase/integrase n=1 Tax=Streptosporangium sp. CA-135522 TaxID=3240072 RepID=UPI003D925F12